MTAPLRHPSACSASAYAALPGATAGAPLFDTLLAHRARLVRMAFRIVQSRHLAEDVVEDVAVKLCEGEGVIAADHPAPFLYRLVRNLAIDRARRLKRERSLAGSAEEAAHVAMPCACPLERLEQREMLAAVIRALDTLPPRTRLAFLRHRIDGMAQKDIAEHLGVSRTLVNFMVRDATKVCRDSIDAYCGRTTARCPKASCPKARAAKTANPDKAQPAKMQPAKTHRPATRCPVAGQQSSARRAPPKAVA
ncbi:sigma-70 family RNA polymerase sigma factor [Xanthobacter oligotrophicus]|uniref:sigma-70 family RNA polymerase sigma factor n=1 Tax=Xanthobacter oligotrophicus TaxID=2607286 RepID=UPI0011F35834|nr:sigma-70 family RNA polymerase sigma factor [Xanthobacter oligotrophicus]MCG5236761.1 sigma-70 family RNA polymerase sigma factor [Xanthobacter oligotrophicus]